MNNNFDLWIKESAPGIKPSQIKKSVHLVIINARLREREKMYRSKLKARKRAAVWAMVVLVCWAAVFLPS